MKRHALVGAALVLVSFAAGLWWQELGANAQTRPQTAAQAKPSAAVKLAPHPQAKLPPLDLPAYALPRSPEQIRTIYKFAAEHPEILTYMPCFCGCEQSGHKGNEDCFVKARAKNGDVTTWQEHGMVCGMCLAVAEEAMKMSAKGSSLTEMRKVIEEKYSIYTDTRTPTPRPPAH